MKSKTDPLVAGLRRLRGLDGAADVAVVLLVGMLGVGPNIGAVHGETGNHFSQGVAQALQGEVARAAMLLGNAVQAAGKHVELAGHRNLHDQALAFVDQVGITLRPPVNLRYSRWKKWALEASTNSPLSRLRKP